MIMHYTIVLETGEQGGYTARCMEVPGAVCSGATKEEAVSHIREAIELVQKTWNDQVRAIIPAVGSEVIRIDVADPA